MCKISARSLSAFLSLLALICLLPGCQKQTAPVIRSPQDAAKARIGVLTGSVGETIAKHRFPEADVQTFDDIMNAVAAIDARKLDAVITSFPTAHQVVKRHRGLSVVAEALDREDTSVAVRKGNDALLNDVNRIISELKADGTLAGMRKRWLKPDLSPYEVLKIDLPNRGTPLRIGVAASREPLSFVDADGMVSGHDGELARRIAAKLHRPIEFHDMKFMALIPALTSGKIDLVVTGMTATDERRKSVDFSIPYFENSQVLLTVNPASPQPNGQLAERAGQDRSIARLSDLADGSIAVLTGSAGDLAARKHFPNAKIENMISSADAALAVKSRKVDSFVYDKSVLLNLAEKDPDLVILDEPVDKLGVAAAISQSNTALLAQVNHALAALKDDGTLKALRAKWVDSRYKVVPPTAPPGQGQSSGVLRMGTCAIIEPFSFHSNGELAGLDIELGRLIAQRLGRRLEIMDMSFEALIPALQSGKIDFALSDFNITEERKKLISFSTPYIENDISALVRRTLPSGQPAPNAASQLATASTQGKLSSPADLADKRIGVLMGSVDSPYATKHYPNAKVLEFNSSVDVVLAVKTKKVDAAFYDEEPLRIVLRDEPSLGAMNENLFSFDVGVGFGKQNASIRDQFNHFLSEIRKNGVYADMVKRWMELGDTHMPQIELPSSGTPLRVAIADVGLPFIDVIDNALVGFDIELATRFAAAAGRPVQFDNMDFDALIAAAQSGKDDLIISSIYITDERRQRIDFSDPYYAMGTKVFALKETLAVSGNAAIGGDASSASEAAPEKGSFFREIGKSFNSNFVLEKRYLLIWDGLRTTILISILATAFGTLLGALVCFMRMSKRPLLHLPAKAYIDLLRGTPVLVLLMLIFYVVFASVNISPILVAVIAFGMNFAAYVSEMFRAGIQSIDRGQTEAAIAVGFTPVQSFLHIVLPQTVQRILPVYKGEFISLLKMTSIVGYIAVQDLTKASDIIRSRTFDAFFPLIVVAIIYFLIAWLLTLGLEHIEKRTNSRRRRIKGATR